MVRSYLVSILFMRSHLESRFPVSMGGGLQGCQHWVGSVDVVFLGVLTWALRMSGKKKRWNGSNDRPEHRRWRPLSNGTSGAECSNLADKRFSC